MSCGDASPWTPERDAQLRALWLQDDPRLSTAQIAVRMGATKNSVVGRAGRIGLPGRDSPIQRGATARGPGGADPEARAARRAAQSRVLAGAEELARARQATAAIAPRVAGNVAPQPARVARIVPQAPTLSPHRTCQWISGEPRGAESAFCGAPTVRGRSYCAGHLARCYRPYDPRVGAA